MTGFSPLSGQTLNGLGQTRGAATGPVQAPQAAMSAQAAFFRSALQAARAVEPEPAATAARPTPTPRGEDGASRPQRPGALLDILV